MSLGLERVSFCGVSLGGMTSLWLAINAPDRIDSLGLCCTSAHLPPPEKWTGRAAVEGARHLAGVERPEAFTRELLRHLTAEVVNER